MTFDDIHRLSDEASKEVLRYMPNLDENSHGFESLVMLYVTKPRSKECVVEDLIFAACPGRFAVQVRGGLDLSEVAGIFPINEPDEALCLANFLLDDDEA